MSTYVARLTPPGIGAIATLAIWGPQAHELLHRHWRPRTPPEKTQPLATGASRVVLGRMGDDEVGDDVVVTLDGANVLVHCHGGETVVAWLMDLLKQAGAREANWHTWLEVQSASAVQADAAVALTQAQTLRCANILLDQHQGTLDRWIENWLARPSQAELESLLGWLPLGLHLTQPWRVALAGAPNVGKSSLCNAILGYQRAITSPIPGTTRDLVTSLTAVEGWPVEIMDTAGLRDEATGIEAEGAALARGAMGGADLVVWLLDPTQPRLPPPADLVRPTLIVLNKIDLGVEPRGHEAQLRVSARTGAGLDDLLARLASLLVPIVPNVGAAIPFTEGQGTTLRKALTALRAGDAGQACAAMSVAFRSAKGRSFAEAKDD